MLFFCRFYGEFLRNVSLTNAQKYDCENEVSKQLAESLKQFYQKNPTLFSCDTSKLFYLITVNSTNYVFRF